MAQKFDVISELYDRACLEIITDPVKWQSFLQTAGRNFKLHIYFLSSPTQNNDAGVSSAPLLVCL